MKYSKIASKKLDADNCSVLFYDTNIDRRLLAIVLGLRYTSVTKDFLEVLTIWLLRSFCSSEVNSSNFKLLTQPGMYSFVLLFILLKENFTLDC